MRIYSHVMPKLVDRLRAHLPEASGRTLKQLLERGRVLVDGAVQKRGDLDVSDEAKIEIASKAPPTTTLKEAPIKIVFEDDGLIVVDKPPGLLTVSERDDADPSVWSLLRNFLREEGRGEPLLVHRLDAPASGLLVFAKSEPMREALKGLFSSHAIDRHYAAIVEGDLVKDEGVFESRLVELEGAPHRVRALRPHDPPEMHDRSRLCLTRWRRIRSQGALHAVEVRLETGRKHQIRAHWSEGGCPIVGDELYGGRKARRLHLHAWSLAFRHPRSGVPVRCLARPGFSFEIAGRGAFGGEPMLRSLDPSGGVAGP